MAIHIQCASKVDLQTDKTKILHYMPCKINSDGDAKVSQYFQPFVNKQDNEQGMKLV